MRRSLHGQGNYTLAPWTNKFQVSTVVWESKTEEEKEQVFQKLLRFTVRLYLMFIKYLGNNCFYIFEKIFHFNKII
jgi:hypothetical protein